MQRNELDELNDFEIITKCLDGDKESFALLVDKYKKTLFRFIYGLVGNREDAGELLQETFLRAYKNLLKFNPDYKFSTWLFQIAKNLSLDYMKKKKPLIVEEDFLAACADSQNNPEQSILEQEKEGELKEAIQKLPTTLKTALLLYHLNGLSYAEIAEVMKIPLHTVKIIILDFEKTSSEYVWAAAAVILALSIGYWLIVIKQGEATIEIEDKVGKPLGTVLF